MKNYFLSVIILIAVSTILFNCQNSNKVEQMLEKEIATENARCPVKMNENVYLDSCKLVADKIMQYHYRLTFSGIDSSNFINSTKQLMIESLKKQPTAALYQKENVGFRYIYSNIEGKYMFQINIDPKDYVQ